MHDAVWCEIASGDHGRLEIIIFFFSHNITLSFYLHTKDRAAPMAADTPADFFSVRAHFLTWLSSLPQYGQSLHVKPYKGEKVEKNVERVTTGIPGLDKMIGGGYPKGTNILVCGSSGTGKTIFCSQFLHAGIVESNEPGIFITLEERTSDLREEMLSLGWNLAEHEQNEKLIVIDAASRMSIQSDDEFRLGEGFDIDALVLDIHRAATKVGAQRLVLDSIPALKLKLSEYSEFRRALFRLNSLLLEVGLTSLMTTESIEPFLVSRFGIEEFLARGIIILTLEEDVSDLKRFLRVRKMRGVRHSLRNVPFEITDKGIVLYVAR
jgi:KaiC/GvpD/RAD55 family RecA-like ATPase